MVRRIRSPVRYRFCRMSSLTGESISLASCGGPIAVGAMEGLLALETRGKE